MGTGESKSIIHSRRESTRIIPKNIQKEQVRQYERHIEIIKQYTRFKNVNDVRFGNIKLHKNEHGQILMRKDFECKNRMTLEDQIEKCEARKRLKHLNLLRIIDYAYYTNLYTRNSCLQVFIEYPLDDLENLTEQKRVKGEIYPPNILLRILRSMLSVLAYLESNNERHGHICPKQIAYFDDDTYKLSDPLNIQPVIGHRANINKNVYQSPEMLRGRKKQDVKNINQNCGKSDVFCLGLIIQELGLMKSIECIYDRDQSKIIPEKLSSMLGNFKDRHRKSDILNEMLKNMLMIDSSKRSTPKKQFEMLTQLVNKKFANYKGGRPGCGINPNVRIIANCISTNKITKGSFFTPQTKNAFWIDPVQPNGDDDDIRPPDYDDNQTGPSNGYMNNAHKMAKSGGNYVMSYFAENQLERASSDIKMSKLTKSSANLSNFAKGWGYQQSQEAENSGVYVPQSRKARTGNLTQTDNHEQTFADMTEYRSGRFNNDRNRYHHSGNDVSSLGKTSGIIGQSNHSILDILLPPETSYDDRNDQQTIREEKEPNGSNRFNDFGKESSLLKASDIRVSDIRKSGVKSPKKIVQQPTDNLFDIQNRSRNNKSAYSKQNSKHSNDNPNDNKNIKRGSSGVIENMDLGESLVVEGDPENPGRKSNIHLSSNTNQVSGNVVKNKNMEIEKNPVESHPKDSSHSQKFWE